MTDLSWLAPVVSVPAVPSGHTPHREHGNPHEQAVSPVFPPVPAEIDNGAQRIHLDELVEAAFEVWEYGHADRIVLTDLARRDPDGLRLALLHDPLIAWHLRARLGPGAPA